MEVCNASRGSSDHPRGRQGAGLPANHLPVPVDGDVGALSVVVGPEVAVWGPKPFIKAVLQGVELGSVPQVPEQNQHMGVKTPLQRSKTPAHQNSMQGHILCLKNHNSKHFNHINYSRAVS